MGAVTGGGITQINGIWDSRGSAMEGGEKYDRYMVRRYMDVRTMVVIGGGKMVMKMIGRSMN